jgi:hypothetical protein
LGTKGLLTDILNYNNADSFYYTEWFGVSFPMVEAIKAMVPRIDMYYQDQDGNFNFDSMSKYSFEKKYRIKKLGDYTEFIKQVEDLKRNKSLTIKDSGINPNSSRGFSLLIVELHINNRKYYKTVLDSPGLETVINVKNKKANMEKYPESYLFWSNPLICFYLATKNQLGFQIQNFNQNFTKNQSDLNDISLAPLINTKDVSNFMSTKNITDIKNLQYNSSTIEKIKTCMAKVIFGKDLKDSNLFEHEIEQEFWSLEIGPEISKNKIHEKYLYEFGVNDEKIKLDSFFNIGVLKHFLNKDKLTLADMIYPLFGVPFYPNCNIIQIGNSWWYSILQDGYWKLDYYQNENLIPSLNKETQNLVISNLGCITFFIAFYAFFYRFLKNVENHLEPIKKMKNEVFSLAFPNKTYDPYVDIFFESIVINEINVLFMCNNKDGNIFNKKNCSNLKAANTLATQMYMTAYLFRELDYCNGSFVKIAFQNDYYSNCSVAIRNLNEETLNKYLSAEKKKLYNVYSDLSSLAIDSFSDVANLGQIYNANFVRNYIFNEHFCDKTDLESIESDTYEKSLFLRNSSTLNIIVLSATLIDKEVNQGRDNALASYTQLFMFNKNSNLKPFRIKEE